MKTSLSLIALLSGAILLSPNHVSASTSTSERPSYWIECSATDVGNHGKTATFQIRHSPRRVTGYMNLGQSNNTELDSEYFYHRATATYEYLFPTHETFGEQANFNEIPFFVSLGFTPKGHQWTDFRLLLNTRDPSQSTLEVTTAGSTQVSPLTIPRPQSPFTRTHSADCRVLQFPNL